MVSENLNRVRMTLIVEVEANDQGSFPDANTLSSYVLQGLVDQTKGEETIHWWPTNVMPVKMTPLRTGVQ